MWGIWWSGFTTQVFQYTLQCWCQYPVLSLQTSCSAEGRGKQFQSTMPFFVLTTSNKISINAKTCRCIGRPYLTALQHTVFLFIAMTVHIWVLMLFTHPPEILISFELFLHKCIWHGEKHKYLWHYCCSCLWGSDERCTNSWGSWDFQLMEVLKGHISISIKFILSSELYRVKKSSMVLLSTSLSDNFTYYLLVDLFYVFCLYATKTRVAFSLFLNLSTSLTIWS